MKITSNVPHPAKYSEHVADLIRELVTAECALHYNRRLTLLDPFGGIGGIHQLTRGLPVQTIAVEIEKEWAEESANYGTTYHADFLGSDLGIEVGTVDIVATSTTYANRMADHHNARDASKRNTYRHTLGRELTEGSSAGLGWTGREGDQYRELHTQAWTRCHHLLRPGGLFICNLKDHYRTLTRGEKSVKMPVTAWHKTTIEKTGFEWISTSEVGVRGNRQGENYATRADFETVFVFRKPEYGWEQLELPPEFHMKPDEAGYRKQLLYDQDIHGTREGNHDH